MADAKKKGFKKFAKAKSAPKFSRLTHKAMTPKKPAALPSAMEDSE